jgi:hypothetical protein
LIGADGLFELCPARVEELVGHANERPQVGVAIAAEEARRDGAVRVVVSVALEQAERDHRVGDDPQGVPWDLGGHGEFIERGGFCGELLE